MRNRMYYFLVKDVKTPVESISKALETAESHLIPHKDMYVVDEEEETCVYYRWYPLPNAAANAGTLPRSYQAIVSPDDTGVWIVDIRDDGGCGCDDSTGRAARARRYAVFDAP